jgi:hypothetical protein
MEQQNRPLLKTEQETIVSFVAAPQERPATALTKVFCFFFSKKKAFLTDWKDFPVSPPPLAASWC